MSDTSNQPAAAVSGASQPLTVPLSDVAVAPQLFMFQPPYALSEAESIRLERGTSLAVTWSVNVFLTGLGAVISTGAPPLFQYFQHKQIVIDAAQFSVASATAVISGLIWIVCKFIPGDYEKIMRKIRQHFEDNPPQQGIGGPR